MLIKKLARRLLGSSQTKPIRNQPKLFSVDYLDDSMKEIVTSVRPYTMTTDARLGHLLYAVDYVCNNSITGSLVECGVWKGGSSLAILLRLNQHQDHRDVYLFDTFEGMTEPETIDKSFRGESAVEMLENSDPNTANVWAKCGLQDVQTNLAKVDYPKRFLHFIKGDVEDTIPEHAPDQIALLRLDTDWYKSTKHEMLHLFPRLAPGGILIVDDYGHWEGARKAVDEYFEEHDIRMFLLPSDYTGRIGVKI